MIIMTLSNKNLFCKVPKENLCVLSLFNNWVKFNKKMERLQINTKAEIVGFLQNVRLIVIVICDNLRFALLCLDWIIVKIDSYVYHFTKIPRRID